MKKILIWGMLVVLMTASAAAFTCPYTGDTSPAEYATVTILPVEKYVGKDITISIIDVYQRDGSKEPANDRLVIVYLIDGEEIISEYNYYTNNDGKVIFKPEDSGSYAVATSGKYIFFDVLARCGDNLCTTGENKINCAQDCSTCGDGTCDIDETKSNCPKDCIICGDGSCDVGENRNTCPKDCARCGDDVCDTNENRVICPVDCVVCGDDVCDPYEVTGFHETSCPEDCAVCGDGYCDSPEDYSTCPEDCSVCGDGSCDYPENSTSCPDDCILYITENTTEVNDTPTGGYVVCGDGMCNDTEDGNTCPEDCVVCGDDICDQLELVSLHETTCPLDCSVCGDGYCDKGEAKTCENDCKDESSDIFLGYFLLPIIIAIIIIVFELSHRFAGTDKKLPKPEAGKRSVKVPKMGKMDTGEVIPYYIAMSASLILATILLAVMGVGYTTNLAALDLFSFLIDNGMLISLFVIFLAAGLGTLARATYYMDRGQAIAFSIAFVFIGMVPALVIFMNIEAVMLLIGMLVGAGFATMTVKREESELIVRKPFKIGASFSDRMLTVAAVFLFITIFLSLYASESTADELSSSIWNSKVTKAAVNDRYGIQTSEAEIKTNVVQPLMDLDIGGVSGRFLIAIGAAALMLGICKLFIIIIRLLAGFFAWMFDKSGLGS